MMTSPAGRALIEQREGRKLRAYRDQVGVLTIGVGHTGRMAPPKVTVGMTITEAECGAILAADLAPLEAAMAKAIKVPVTQNEWDALQSLGFNIGAGGATHSTVIKRLNLGDVAGAADAFRMWEKPASLAGRREAERKQFLDHDSPAALAQVSAARAATLEARAGKAAGTAKVATKAAATTAVAGVAAAGGIATAAQPGFALAAGGIIALATVAQGVAAWWHARHATALAAGAATQRVAAATAGA